MPLFDLSDLLSRPNAAFLANYAGFRSPGILIQQNLRLNFPGFSMQVIQQALDIFGQAENAAAALFGLPLPNPTLPTTPPSYPGQAAPYQYTVDLSVLPQGSTAPTQLPFVVPSEQALSADEIESKAISQLWAWAKANTVGSDAAQALVHSAYGFIINRIFAGG